MGGAQSTNQSDDKRKRAKRRYRRLKREHHRLSEELKQRQGVDEYGVKCFFNDEGEPFYFDEEGYVFYMDETRTPYYKDVDGNICYVSVDGQVYYIDKKGRQYYLDDNGERYYLQEDGTRYYIDKNEEKYYKDDHGQPYYIDEFDEVYYVDENGRDFYLDEAGEIMYKDTKGRKYYANGGHYPKKSEGRKSSMQSKGGIMTTGGRKNSINDPNLSVAGLGGRQSSTHDRRQSVAYSVNNGEIGDSNSEHEDTETIERIPIKMRNRITSHKYVRRGSSQVTVSGVVIKTGTPRSWIKGKSFPPVQEEEEEVDLPEELTGRPESTVITSVHPASTVEITEVESEIISPSPVQNINNSKLAEEYELDVVNFDALREIKKESDSKVLRKLLEEELNKRNLPPRQIAQRVGEFPVKVQDDKMKCSITSSVFLGDGSLVLSDWNNKKLKLFNTELDFVSALKLDFFPQSMCGRPNEFELYVTFKSAVVNAIQVIKVENERMSLVRKINLYGIGYGISGNNEGLAVVVRTFEGWQIHLINLKGKVLRTIIHEIDDQDMFASPNYITVSKDLKIFASDRGTNQIHGFNSYGDLECTAEGIRDPKGLCSNNNGSIYVTNPSGMHQISDGGHKVGTVITQKQAGFPPSNVCYDEQDRLVILTGVADTMVAFQISDRKGYYYKLKKPEK